MKALNELYRKSSTSLPGRSPRTPASPLPDIHT
jgi:hypothetical protein